MFIICKCKYNWGRLGWRRRLPRAALIQELSRKPNMQLNMHESKTRQSKNILVSNMSLVTLCSGVNEMLMLMRILLQACNVKLVMLGMRSFGQSSLSWLTTRLDFWIWNDTTNDLKAARQTLCSHLLSFKRNLRSRAWLKQCQADSLKTTARSCFYWL